MGKLVYFVSALVIIDLFFLLTGQMGIASPSSVILSAILNPASVKSSAFWIAIIGAGGIATLTAIGGVTTGLITSRSETLIYAGVAAGLSVLVGDYISIYAYLNALNPVLAITLMAPIIIMFAFTILEWLRAKD